MTRAFCLGTLSAAQYIYPVDANTPLQKCWAHRNTIQLLLAGVHCFAFTIFQRTSLLMQMLQWD